MAKVYPESETIIPVVNTKNPIVLTVWKKSLIFGCEGFTVYNSNGNLAFRVDNYFVKGNREIVLMDALGCSLHTVRHKSLADNFLVYDGESVNSRFSVTKHVNVLNTKSLAYVSTVGSSKNRNKIHVIYEIQGSYAQKFCMVYDDNHRCVAEIRRKEAKGGVALGGDVFALVVQPSIDPAIAMVLVIVLDQMFDSSRRLSK
ncbi:putative tubby-like protein [Helianthus annuus]|uniref:Putative tubby C-terminal-like domain-containing protein n=1 Tax=Helianthus annuus TaxID=4232 RepID=A0A251TE53_HELAN|nr:protein LURP-one-related 8 [Helianthus annuus]KAF5783967.1 putative tubby-like protein [Helianthus annuus]KAJ0503207.1 putative tubby-like protein [Helianthus annuus]KAJ0511487.1 putative tubby-like protein [Helianthus annuus]KAJ0519176.1 putative tubby-like protein [Helianthus annuus]KAJ0690970.1 putative tubby-like protein [Helianthus annuus]